MLIFTGLPRDRQRDSTYLISFDKTSNSILFNGSRNKTTILQGNETQWTLKFVGGDQEHILTLSKQDNFLPTGRKVWTDSSSQVL